ncbi:helix-turn-helix domain-containing protein [Cellulosimicrobium funkei]
MMSPERLATARASVAGGQSVAAVARALGVSVSTVRRHLADHV